MSLTPTLISSKLNSLSDAQDSIISVSQWIGFHRRNAQLVVQVWQQVFDRADSQQKLQLLYVANDVCQQARARKRDEFPKAFAPIIAKAVATAYATAPLNIQGRIKHIVEVWKQRSVFPEAVIEKCIDVKQSAKANKSPSSHTNGHSRTDNLPQEWQQLLRIKKDIIHLQSQQPMDTVDSLTFRLGKALSGNNQSTDINSLISESKSAIDRLSARIRHREDLLKQIEKCNSHEREYLDSESQQLQRLMSLSSKGTGVSTDENRAEVTDEFQLTASEHVDEYVPSASDASLVPAIEHQFKNHDPIADLDEIDADVQALIDSAKPVY